MGGNYRFARMNEFAPHFHALNGLLPTHLSPLYSVILVYYYVIVPGSIPTRGATPVVGTGTSRVPATQETFHTHYMVQGAVLAHPTPKDSVLAPICLKCYKTVLKCLFFTTEIRLLL